MEVSFLCIRCLSNAISIGYLKFSSNFIKMVTNESKSPVLTTAKELFLLMKKWTSQSTQRVWLPFTCRGQVPGYKQTKILQRRKMSLNLTELNKVDQCYEENCPKTIYKNSNGQRSWPRDVKTVWTVLRLSLYSSCIQTY